MRITKGRKTKRRKGEKDTLGDHTWPEIAVVSFSPFRLSAFRDSLLHFVAPPFAIRAKTNSKPFAAGPRLFC
jgi:hypothetical protein